MVETQMGGKMKYLYKTLEWFFELLPYLIVLGTMGYFVPEVAIWLGLMIVTIGFMCSCWNIALYFREKGNR